MATRREEPSSRPPGDPGHPRRIETQIHRRRKARAVPPLQAEWEAESGGPPSGLRMPQDRMDRRRDRQ
jgi:hypothetical protein